LTRRTRVFNKRGISLSSYNSAARAIREHARLGRYRLPAARHQGVLDEGMEQLLLATSDARAPLPNPLVELSTHGEVAVHVRFAEQARRFPERAAVVDERGTWTYRELEQRGNQLANYLRARGIRNQDIVAIDGARCASLVWAMLGVLKAGAAFVILDRSYPAPRLIDRLRIAQPRAYLLLDEAGEARLPLAESVEAALSGWRITLSRCATGAIGDPLHEHSTQATGSRDQG